MTTIPLTDDVKDYSIRPITSCQCYSAIYFFILSFLSPLGQHIDRHSLLRDDHAILGFLLSWEENEYDASRLI